MEKIAVPHNKLSPVMSNISDLSVSNIIGYASHLPSKVVKLPLKYDSLTKSLDATEEFRHNCNEFSEVIDISSQSGYLFPAIQVGVSHDRKTIKLVPLLIDESAPLCVDFQTIDVALPHPIISRGTISSCFLSSADADEPYLVIDFIDESYLLVTLKIEINDFLMGSTANRLVIDNFSEWVHISVPYSFELRSQPFFLKALNQLDLIVSLKDGGLLHLSRPTVLSSFDIFHFSDTVPLMSLNFVTAIFAKPTKTEMINKGLSHSAVVDLIALNETEFVALSVDKVLTVWSLSTHKQVGASRELGTSESSSTWLTTYPNKYFLTRHNEQTTMLTMLIPSHHDSQTQSSGYECISWNTSYGKLEDESRIELDSSLYEQETNSDPKISKVQDFDIVVEGNTTKYYVLWKSNSFSTVVCYHQDSITKNITSYQKSVYPLTAHLSDLNPHGSSEYYLDCVFNSGACDTLAVSCALEIFAKNSGFKSQTDNSEGLRQKVSAAISSTSAELGLTESSMWYKFALICFEFGKPSSDSLSLSVVENLIVSAQANGIGLYKDAHFFESALSNKQGSKLSELLKVISSKLSNKTLKKIYNEALKVSQIDPTKASELATEFLSRKISDLETQGLMKELESIPNVVDEINNMISCDENWSIVSEAFGISAGEGNGLLSKLWVVQSFEAISKSHEIILVYLFVLFLLCEVNESVLQFLNAISNKLRAYSVMKEVLDICFASSSSSSSVEKSGVALKENSIFWTAAVDKNVNLKTLLSRKEFNSAFDYLTTTMLSNPKDLMLDVVLELINRNEGEIVSNQFASKLDRTSPVNKFIFGIVSLLNRSPTDFYDAFKEYSTFEGVKEEGTREKLLDSLGTNIHLKSFLSSIFADSPNEVRAKANYFYQAAQLLKAYLNSSDTSKFGKPDMEGGKVYLAKALAFEEQAIVVLEEASDHSEASLLTTYLRNYFSDALGIAKFDEATKSLAKLQDRLNKSEFRSFLRQLCKAVIAKKQIQRFFSEEKSSLFSTNYTLVDSIILEIANEDLILFNALKCYEYLYSWRLYGGAAPGTQAFGDRRGAAEALYMFITRFKSEKESLMSENNELEDFKQFKLKILELYKVILNTLKTFSSDEDKWVRMRSKSDNLEIIRLNELNVEYYKWIKEIESDFF